MKKIIFVLSILWSFQSISQNKLIDLTGMTVDDLKELRKIVYSEQAKREGLPLTKEDDDFLKRTQDAIDKNPRINATFAFRQIPQKYAELLFDNQMQQLTFFFEQRPKYQKAKRWAKMIYAQDTTLFWRKSAKLRIKFADLQAMKNEQ